mgnify:CR=1 FL=1
MNEFDKFDDSISKEFYSDIVSIVEKFYNKSKTFGERALIGDIITMINNKCVVKDNKLERKFDS